MSPLKLEIVDVFPLGFQVYEYGKVPPVTVATIFPLFKPKQVTSVIANETSNTFGSVIVTELILTQEPESVIVTV